MNSFSQDENSLQSATSRVTQARPAPLTPEHFTIRGAAAPREKSSSLLLDYLHTLNRYRLAIAVCATIGFLLSMLWNVTTLPIYEGRTSIDMQSLNGDFMNMRSVAPTSDQSDSSSDSYVQTQIKLLQSETLLENTAARLEAEQHPAFIPKNDLLSGILRRLHMSRGASISYKDLVNYSAQHVKVKPVGLTRLIEINCDSWSPTLSAKFCNTLTDEYQVEDQQSRGMDAQKTSDWLARQAEDVRAKAEQSQRNLETAVGGNGLILSQVTDTVGEDRLRDIQQELVKAQADRMEKEAQTAIASSSSADTIAGIVDRSNYQNEQRTLNELESELAKISPPLTEEAPKVIHLRSQIKQVEDAMEREQDADTSRMKNDYDAARHREALLKATYDAQAATVSADLGKAARVRLLRSEVESEQQLYQVLLQRAKEAGFASAMHASTVHMVDAARAPTTPIAPRRESSAAVGVLLGTVAGVGFAFFKDRNYHVLRVPGEAPRYLNLHELGVIPSASISGNQLASSAQAFSLKLRGGPQGLGNALTMANWNDNFSLVAEAYRSVTLSILLSRVEAGGPRTYVIASPSASDGKTSITSNLGVALSKSKLKVLLVDGDLRRPTLHNVFGISNKSGLRDRLRLDDVTGMDICLRTEIPNLFVLPSGSGTEQALDLLNADHLARLLKRFRKEFDVILIDTPPMLHISDARLFARYADGVIMVVRSGVTMREDAASAIDIFAHDGVPVIGTILNDFDPRKQGISNYYKSYYQYQDRRSKAEEVGAK